MCQKNSSRITHMSYKNHTVGLCTVYSFRTSMVVVVTNWTWRGSLCIVPLSHILRILHLSLEWYHKGENSCTFSTQKVHIWTLRTTKVSLKYLFKRKLKVDHMHLPTYYRDKRYTLQGTSAATRKGTLISDSVYCYCVLFADIILLYTEAFMYFFP